MSSLTEAAPSQGTPLARQHSFPPFPVAPEDVTIVPFKDFVECGIQVFEGEDDVERDGLGIPTIALRVKHDTDISKTNPNRGQKTVRELRAARASFRKEWWEDWAEGEDLRNHGPYNHNAAPIDRIHQAASDFQKYRKFPPISTKVQWLWDQFRIYAGLLGTTPVWQRESDKAGHDDNEVSDDDFEDQPRGGERQSSHRPRPRAPYELYGKAPTLVQNDDEIRGLLDTSRAAKEDKIANCLEDPARSIQIFLSSYVKYEGIIWEDRNLINAPHLLRFFVNYLLRNDVLHDKTLERSLRAALLTIDTAAIELPLTSKLSKAMPDDFSLACQGCFGPVTDGGLLHLSEDGNPDLVAGEPVATHVELDSAEDAAIGPIIEEGDVLLIDEEDALPPAARDPAAAAISEPVSDPAAEGEEPDAAWGNILGDDLPAVPIQSWDGPITPPEEAWALPAPPSLSAIVGDAAAGLPRTHAPGVVEWSVRRVRSILAPPPVPIAPVPGVEAEAVERALETKLHRVVLAPWPAWDGEARPALSEPHIVRSAPGALASPAAAAAAAADVKGDQPGDGPAHAGRPKPHDMHADDITLLVTAEVAALLRIGMGVGGTWVQLARRCDMEEPVSSAAGVSATEQKKKLTKAQKERRGLRYWYLNEVMMALPSYWLV